MLPIPNRILNRILAENAHPFKALQAYIEVTACENVAHLYKMLSFFVFMVVFSGRLSCLETMIAFSISFKEIPWKCKDKDSAQALADYAEIIIHVKEKFHAQRSPVIVVGASYGGIMLASWFRLKYPRIALGALASFSSNLEDNQSCHDTIKKSWTVIDKIASEPDGLSILSKKFETCKPLNNSSELKDYLADIYMAAAQYDAPPSYPVTMVCRSIDEPSFGNDILGRIFFGMVAYQGELPCYVNEPTKETETDVGWSWQNFDDPEVTNLNPITPITCADMVIRFGINNDSMFQPYPFDLNAYINDCKDEYGVPPRPHWGVAEHIRQCCCYHYCEGYVLMMNLIIVVMRRRFTQHKLTTTGSHCLDVLATTKSDPQWLGAQRKEEVRIIRKWIRDYFSDLDACKKGKHH
ncbi:hypothetical protein NC651_038052 [Populus alba x Populus x berolinensis]|nr:hypothetical protein NC651_038052 [Populus alba x Populus x berolinensis]